MKKTIISIILMTTLCLTGCGGTTISTEKASNEKIKVETEEVEKSASELVSSEDYVSPQNTGALQVKDSTLCDMDGNKVQLKGVSTHGIARMENFINQDMFLEMRNDWGVNIVRFAMYIHSMDGYVKSDLFKEKNTQIMEKGVQLATDCDMYALVDWHVLDEKTPMKYVEESKEFFDYFSAKYKDYDNIIYEICNEPNETEWSEIKEYANQVIPVIRANDPDAIIIVGTPEWSQRVDEALADPFDFENIMYTLHFYSASHKDELRNRMLDCLDAGLPIFVTEYGVTNANGMMPRDLDEADKWMEALDENNISCCIWCLSKNGDACNLLARTADGFSGFEGDDFNETGKWYLEMMRKYKERIRNNQK